MINTTSPKNSITQIVDWLYAGDCVVLHEDAILKSTRIYHQCIPTKDLEKLEKPITIRYVDYAARPDYIDLWRRLLEEAELTPCICTLQNVILNPETPETGYLFEQYAIEPLPNDRGLEDS